MCVLLEAVASPTPEVLDKARREMPAAAAAVAPPIRRLCVEKRLGFSPTARMHSLIEAAKEPQVRYLPFAKWSRGRCGKVW